PVPSAPRAEVEQPPTTTITVDWDGVAVEIPAAIEDWDVEALEAFETGRAIRALRLLLGDGPLPLDGLEQLHEVGGHAVVVVEVAFADPGGGQLVERWRVRLGDAFWPLHGRPPSRVGGT
ncbi:MAG TPA: hypothetical protein VKZ72_08910, partial [Acidimicrobiales bacterium]|nr:hypothetical protein [Acidimicrobiales bacterium]